MVQAARRKGGAHRKQSNPAKSRIAVAVAATTAITSAGAVGAATAATTHPTQHSTEGYKLAADATSILPKLDQLGALPQPPKAPQLPHIDPAALSPQILSIVDYKPVADLSRQVQKAIEYHTKKVAEDLASRVPEVVRPAQGILTSGFGTRWGAIHHGVDIANALGTPIYAAEDGTVISAGPASGFGQWVRVRHDDGTITVYGHMETIDCHVGQRVHAGQQIAGMGSRGFSTGVHLHFEVHPHGGAAIDPIPWLAARGIHL